MKKLTRHFLTGFILLAPTLAGGTPPECKVDVLPPDSKTYVKRFVTYFFKPLPKTDWYGFSGAEPIAGDPGSASSTNYLVNKGNPSTMIKVPGPYDLVPTPGGEWLTWPNPDKGIYFIKSSKLTRQARPGQTVDARKTKPDLFDAGLDGTYTTLGRLPRRTPATYRAIAEVNQSNNNALPIASKIYFKDYRESADGSRIAPVTSGPGKLLCPGHPLKNPILSKDGGRISAYDVRLQKMRIFKVNDDGSCKSLLVLPFATGKIDFSYDGKQIAFHLDTFSRQNQGAWYSGLHESMVKNVFTATLTPNPDGTLAMINPIRLTSNLERGIGSFYPTWLPPDAGGKQKVQVLTIDRIDAQGKRVDPSRGKFYHFDIYDPSKGVPARAIRFDSDCVGCRDIKARSSLIALGALWGRICMKTVDRDVRPQDFGAIALSLDPAACRKLVRDYWGKVVRGRDMKAEVLRDGRARVGYMMDRDIVRNLSADALDDACPSSSSRSGPTPTLLRGTPTLVRREPDQIFAAACKSCHQEKSAGMSNIRWASMSKRQIDGALKMLSQGSTAPAHHLIDGKPILTIDPEITVFKAALQRKRLRAR